MTLQFSSLLNTPAPTAANVRAALPKEGPAQALRDALARLDVASVRLSRISVRP